MTEERVIEVPAESFSRREERALPTIQRPTTLLQAITAAAADPSIDIEKVERLWLMHEKMVAREAEAAFNEAMARTQAEIQPVVNNATNAHTSSSYAKLEQIDRIITPVHTRHGLSISYDTETKNNDDPIPDGMLRTVAIVSHAAGHSRRHHIDLPPDDAGSQGKINKTGVQARGSTNTYARRYLKLMIFNVSTFDDRDGNANKRNDAVVEPDPAGKKALEKCGSSDSLLAAWKALTPEQRKTLGPTKDACKASIAAAEKAAAEAQ